MPMFDSPIGMRRYKNMLCFHSCAKRPPFQTSHRKRDFCFTKFKSIQQATCVCIIDSDYSISVSTCKIFLIWRETYRKYLCLSIAYCHLVSNFTTKRFVYWLCLYFFQNWLWNHFSILWWILLLWLLHLWDCPLLSNDCILVKFQFL